MVELFLERGADVDVADNDGKMALWHAVEEYKHSETLQLSVVLELGCQLQREVQRWLDPNARGVLWR